MSTSSAAYGPQGPPGRGPDPRAARSRAAALTAAQELLVEQGWAAVTHVAVAARSGVGRTTLYRHWPDTSGMLRDAIVQRIQAAHITPSGDLRADLVGELDALRRLLHDPVSEHGMRAVIERAGADPEFAALKQELYAAGSRVQREILERARAAGELPSGLDVDLAIDRLAGPLVYRRLLAGGAFGTDVVRAVVDGFLAAESPRP
ncbi:TetR/AcrR family transcriptional regulator C-terminal ligand-binding domain-containing protein [Streptomyces cocklensis]|jgi:AcrR family transcriptional regulator|uniref:Transcriptional regulator, TetR family n=1 Tax=Actinacidiphila cocklensis TaxID=887465 RepID=A0A9W4E6U6_9ACTN|nr:TetR-like C-terminal domain-containing protein [Actinacidiphila cocklensis]MDD1059183.1 TetR/AcrR family transcriptional regulator C-terminal ligand-binding domain-containing protein [Actinacidiphila cocklensis]WSX73306.1 TetR/AcrR family transcriptional regulator C-terminal ligand-binding domain-containing protein [Streptomyces sp. NBC_00899]WSX80628.1 TetR/AcrR family transcriptional regulator C-terminal ligand-binding domain-containing protein [Streptomyces sp. NBC_00899]CAG6394419.1 Tran